jgi:hypothetical protein
MVEIQESPGFGRAPAEEVMTFARGGDLKNS